MKTRIVRINGTPLRVVWNELPDPYPDGYGPAYGTGDTTCDALEPDWPDGTGGVAVCTMPVHDDSAGHGTVHIAHGGQNEVIAIWGEPALLSDDDLY